MKSSSGVDPFAADRFPAPVYTETVLAVNFDDARKYFLEALLEMHAAHTLMLLRQGIIPVEDARTCLQALAGLDRQSIREAVYDGRHEDLFFYVENLLAERCGIETAGKMHTARSRNDIDITLYRMCFRRELLKTAEALQRVRRILIDLASRHIETLMPAHTHTQPAQPTTLAHYLLAAIEFLGRDIGRMQAAFATTNRNPLGSCAITTTGFPIDRNYTAELLGFEGLQLNSYGSIAVVDYITEAVSAVAVAMINLGKLVQDLLQWCTDEYGFLRLSDAWVQCSSIMPQKRNPVALEHTRILASKALGQAQAVLTCTHNTPFGDIVDSEDDLQPLVFNVFIDANRALQLFAGLMSSASFNEQKMRERAGGSFLTVTELADTLVRQEKLSFREAHHIVSDAVKALNGDYSVEGMITAVRRLAPGIIGRPLASGEEVLRKALDPANFVAIRNIPGGPAPQAVQDALRLAEEEWTQQAAWIAEKSELLASYPQHIQAAVTSL